MEPFHPVCTLLCAYHCQAPPTPGRATGEDLLPEFVPRVGAFASIEQYYQGANIHSQY